MRFVAPLLRILSRRFTWNNWFVVETPCFTWNIPRSIRQIPNGTPQHSSQLIPDTDSIAGKRLYFLKLWQLGRVKWATCFRDLPFAWMSFPPTPKRRWSLFSRWKNPSTPTGRESERTHYLAWFSLLIETSHVWGRWISFNVSRETRPAATDVVKQKLVFHVKHGG